MGEFGKFEVVIFLVLGFIASTHADTGLVMNYYKDSCPNAEKIVQEFINNYVPSGRPSAAANLIRLHFHDCFVEGCDASVMLSSAPDSGNKTERVSPINLTLKGFDIIDKVKTKLEDECPGVVSCADILALAARDAIYSIGGPHWLVPTGRKDGNKSTSSKPLKELPFPTENFTSLEIKFQNKGLDLIDLVMLSGAHTIGISHCTSFTQRLYNFTGKGDQDPALDPKYAKELKDKCPDINSGGNVTMDPKSTNTFDLSYYIHVVQKMGLFESDAALLTSLETKSAVNRLANGDIEYFKQQFANAMAKMGNIDVKIGSQGQVRKNCSIVNPKTKK